MKAKPIVKVLWVILAVIVVAIIFSPDDKGSAPQAANGEKPQEAAATKQDQDAPQFTTTARELAKMYEENTVAADNKFKDKRFEIAGTVTDISTDFIGSAVIELSGGVNQFMEPRAELDDSQKQKAAGLKKGQKIVLICTGSGDISKTPMLDDCLIK